MIRFAFWKSSTEQINITWDQSTLFGNGFFIITFDDIVVVSGHNNATNGTLFATLGTVVGVSAFVTHPDADASLGITKNAAIQFSDTGPDLEYSFTITNEADQWDIVADTMEIPI